MADRIPINLGKVPISPEHPAFAEILGWPFADLFVARLLRNDIPQRVRFGNCRVWGYSDPAGLWVGFGTLDVCTDYGDYTGGQPHPYIPLLAVNPKHEGLGHGTTIVRHLIGEAALLAAAPAGCHNVLYLDVYTASTGAIKLYLKCGFTQITPQPIPDPDEGDKPYIVMARRVSVADAWPPPSP